MALSLVLGRVTVHFLYSLSTLFFFLNYLYLAAEFRHHKPESGHAKREIGKEHKVEVFL